MKTNLILKLLVFTLVCFALSYGFAEWGGLNQGTRFPLSVIKRYAERDRNQKIVETKKVIDGKLLNEIDLSTVSADVKMGPAAGSDLVLTLKSTRSSLFADLQQKVLNVQVKEPESSSPHFGFEPAESETLAIEIPSNIKILKGESVSGNLSLEKVSFETLSLNSLSGDLRSKDGKDGVVNLKTVSGNVRVTGTWNQLKGTTISGDFNLGCEMSAPQILVSSTSGDVSIYFSSNPDAKVNFGSVSGSANYETDAEKKITSEKSFHRTFGAGKGSIEVNTISGDLNLR